MRHLSRQTVWLSVSITLLSCGGKPPVVAPKPAKPQATLQVVPGRPDGRSLLEADAARGQAVGAGALQLVGAELLSEGDRLGAFVEVPENECALAMARGSASIVDLDLFAYEDDGTSFAVDESTDARPAILVCPPHPRRVWIAARVVSGTGLVGLGVQSVPLSALAEVERVAGAHGRSGGETGRLESWPGLEAKLITHRGFLGGRWEEVRRAAVPVAPRASSRITAPLEAGRCLDVFVSPAEEVGSLEVIAEDNAGRILVRGRDRGRDRSFVLCSATTVDVTVAVRPRSSTGLVAIIASRSAPSASATLEPASRAEYVTETRPLDESRAALERALAGKGYGPAKTIATGTAKLGTRAAATIDLPSGCARIDVVAGNPLADVGSSLWNDRGSLLAEGRGGHGLSLFACGPQGAARIDVEALGHPGPYAIELRRDKTAPAALVAHPLAASRLLGVLDAGGVYASASMAEGAQIVALEAGTRATLPLDVPSRGCVEVTASLDRAGSGLDLRLADSSTGESTVTRGRFVVTDRFCASKGGAKGTAELRLMTGKAEALVLLRLLEAD